MRDRMSIRGAVHCYKLHHSLGDKIMSGDALMGALDDGSAELLWEQHNLVVNIGLQALSVFLGNNLGSPTVNGSTFSSLSDITVGSMEIGNTVSPTAPAPTNTSSVGALVYVPPITVSYVSSPYGVVFSGVIPTSECNGLLITEEALKLRNGLVCAKTTFAPQVKTSSFGLMFVHTILVSGS